MSQSIPFLAGASSGDISGSMSGRRVPRSVGQNGYFYDRTSRAGIKNLLMAYEECLRASEGIRFKKRENTNIDMNNLNNLHRLESLALQLKSLDDNWSTFKGLPDPA
jgi:hypothetical protein